MTTVSLSDLLDIRDASIRVEKLSAFAKVRIRIRRISLAPARRILLLALLAVTGFVHKQGLVLAGCTAVVISSAMVSAALGFLVTGVAFFYLELRRR